MTTTTLSNRIIIFFGAAVASVALLHNDRILSPVFAFSTMITQLNGGNSYTRQSSSLPTFFSLHVSSSSSAVPDDSFAFDDIDHNGRRRTEFTDLGSIEESMERQRRIQQEERNEQRFVKYGDDLWALRKLMNKLSHKLLRAIDVGMRDEEMEIREQLRQVQQQDPQIVYKMEVEQLKLAKREGRDADARRHSRNANNARSCLPHYNLEGLWVGK
jgi:hypothetical protein